MNYRCLPVLLLSLACVGTSHALTINDLDLNLLSFDVDDISAPPAIGDGITGTSNGIAWKYQGDAIYQPFSSDTGGQTYSGLPGGFDALHVSHEFTLTFAEPITAILMALANDNNTGDGPDFGLVPSELDGATDLGAGQIRIDDISGALVLFQFATPVTVLTHTNSNGINDGFDLSFFAYTTAVPIPPAAGLLIVGIAALARYRRG